MDEVKHYPWSDKFQVSEEDIKKWQQSAPQSSLTFYALKKHLINKKDYYEWAINHYQIPKVDDMYFEQHLLKNTEWHEIKDTYDWTEEVLPIAFWNNTVFIGCVELNDKVPKQLLGFESRVVLVSQKNLEIIWAFLETVSDTIKKTFTNFQLQASTLKVDGKALAEIKKEKSSNSFQLSDLKTEKLKGLFEPDLPNKKKNHPHFPLQSSSQQSFPEENERTRQNYDQETFPGRSLPQEQESSLLFMKKKKEEKSSFERNKDLLVDSKNKLSHSNTSDLKETNLKLKGEFPPVALQPTTQTVSKTQINQQQVNLKIDETPLSPVASKTTTQIFSKTQVNQKQVNLKIDETPLSPVASKPTTQIFSKTQVNQKQVNLKIDETHISPVASKPTTQTISKTQIHQQQKTNLKIDETHISPIVSKSTTQTFSKTQVNQQQVNLKIDETPLSPVASKTTTQNPNKANVFSNNHTATSFSIVAKEKKDYQYLWDYTKKYYCTSIVLNVKEDKAYIDSFHGKISLKQKDKFCVDFKDHTFFKVVQRGYPYHGFIIETPANKKFFTDLGWDKYPLYTAAIPIKDSADNIKKIFVGFSLHNFSKTEIQNIQNNILDIFHKRTTKQVA